MELREAISGKRVYVDTNILIYLFEGFAEYLPLMQQLAQCVDSKEISLLTGEITLAELMVMPFKNNDTNAINLYTKALNDRKFITLIPTTQKVYIKTAFLRATLSGMKTPDSIHVASAVEGKADVFITNDQGIKTPKGLEKLMLRDFL